jgi:hypothetical protein
MRHGAGISANGRISIIAPWSVSSTSSSRDFSYEHLASDARSIARANLLVLPVVFGLSALFVPRRFTALTAVLCLVFLGIATISPHFLDGGPDRIAYLASYNRYAWVLFGLVMIACAIEPKTAAKDRRLSCRDIIEGFGVAIALIALFYLKLPGAAAAVGLMVICGFAERQARIRILVALATTTVSIALLSLTPLNQHYLSDLREAALDQRITLDLDIGLTLDQAVASDRVPGAGRCRLCEIRAPEEQKEVAGERDGVSPEGENDAALALGHQGFQRRHLRLTSEDLHPLSASDQGDQTAALVHLFLLLRPSNTPTSQPRDAADSDPFKPPGGCTSPLLPNALSTSAPTFFRKEARRSQFF